MSFTNPTIADFKTYFVRDFNYGATTDLVMDADLTKALDKAAAYIASDCFPTQAQYTIGFYYLMAHFLVSALQTGSQGATGQGRWLVNSHSVGSVSEGFSIPDDVLKNPYLSLISKTSYGQEYLMLIYPKLTGQMWYAEGTTRP